MAGLCEDDNESPGCLKPSCCKNYHGFSGGMEAAGMKLIFHRSQEKYGVRYVKYLGDGDSIAFKSVFESEPYGSDCPIEKLECVGHVQKCMGSRLLKLTKDMKGKKLEDGKGIGGAGRLTKKEIQSIQMYYGAAIRQNVGNLDSMQHAVWAIYFHKLSTDAKPQHVVQIAKLDAILVYNDGNVGRIRTLQELGFEPGAFTINILQGIDSRRIDSANTALQKIQQEVRQKILKRKEAEDLQEEQEYGAGDFRVITPIASYGIELIWEKLTNNDLAKLENVKARFLKRVLGVEKQSPTRIVYVLAKEIFFIEDLRLELMLPSTARIKHTWRHSVGSKKTSTRTSIVQAQ
ncbi:hypothetical protein ANN_23693 [Periplaneta americana]|uniref:Mutator-like transposase domain-containing protein n=1 Tax=Periplaneta americana TaxID=6978 RepID=A0ABQ8SLT6_PERAM|nr:hypothetical protein ANN_23693 [Periplaneta americana]